MRDGLQNGSQSFKSNSDVQQMCGEEEVIEVPHNGEGEIPERVQERVVGYGDSCLPYLVTPVDVYYTGVKKLSFIFFNYKFIYF